MIEKNLRFFLLNRQLKEEVNAVIRENLTKVTLV